MESKGPEDTLCMCSMNWICAFCACSKALFGLTITKTCLFKYIENFTTKNWKFSDKNSDCFHISAQNIACRSLKPPQWGGSNGYQQSMFFRRNKNINVYTCKAQFYCMKVGFKGQHYIGVFSWCSPQINISSVRSSKRPFSIIITMSAVVILAVAFNMSCNSYWMLKLFMYFSCPQLWKVGEAYHYENTPIQIYGKFHHQKTENFQIKKLWYISYFCSKYRLWVLVRTTSSRQF